MNKLPEFQHGGITGKLLSPPPPTPTPPACQGCLPGGPMNKLPELHPGQICMAGSLPAHKPGALTTREEEKAL